MEEDPKSIILFHGRQSGKTLAAKKRWIEETQRFQRIAKDDVCDTDEVLGQQYDEMMSERRLRRLRDVQVIAHEPEPKEGVYYKGTRVNFDNFKYNTDPGSWNNKTIIIDNKGNKTEIYNERNTDEKG